MALYSDDAFCCLNISVSMFSFYEAATDPIFPPLDLFEFSLQFGCGSQLELRNDFVCVEIDAHEGDPELKLAQAVSCRAAVVVGQSVESYVRLYAAVNAALSNNRITLGNSRKFHAFQTSLYMWARPTLESPHHPRLQQTKIVKSHHLLPRHLRHFVPKFHMHKRPQRRRLHLNHLPLDLPRRDQAHPHDSTDWIRSNSPHFEIGILLADLALLPFKPV